MAGHVHQRQQGAHGIEEAPGAGGAGGVAVALDRPFQQCPLPRRKGGPQGGGAGMRLKASLAEMKEEIDRLHEKGHALKDEAKARWTEKMADLEAKQQVARDKLDEVRKSTGEAWGHMEKGAQAAWDDVRKAFQEAAEEF